MTPILKTPAELRAQKTTELIVSMTTIMRDLIKWTSLAVMTFFLGDTLKVLAGKITIANLTVDVSTGEPLLPDWLLAVIHGVPVTITIICLLVALKERKLRKQTVTRLQARIRMFEELHDPHRSSAPLGLKQGLEKGEDRES